MSKYYAVFYNELEDNNFTALIHASDDYELQSKINDILASESSSSLLSCELVEDY